MKVVIFCGGMGVRMGEATQRIPKPMIPVGAQPILWHIMRWYASWGHTEFILCLGYRAEIIKQYFLDYNEAVGNDFVLSSEGVTLLGSDMEGWRITFLDTGVHAQMGDRLRAARAYLGDDEYFLATYGDGLTDAPLDEMIDRLVGTGKKGLFMSVRPRLSYHVVDADEDGVVRSIEPMARADVRINGGFFVLSSDIFEQLEPGEDIMDGAARMASDGEPDRVPLRRLLGADGHNQGQAGSRRDRAQRRHPMASSPQGPDRGLMLELGLGGASRPIRRVLAVGCHADDIEIGCGGTLLALTRSVPGLEVTWVVLCAGEQREQEARASAAAFLEGAGVADVRVHPFRDGFLPYLGADVKDVFEGLKPLAPDLVFTHTRSDLHQDHRLACELTWNTFRDHLVLEYEIPKYDGDLGAPNVFVPLDESQVDEKLRLIRTHYPSQSDKHWFDGELFRSLMRIRGMEAATRYAEAFTSRKLKVTIP